MEKRSSNSNATYLALYYLKENRKNEILAHRLVWAQESILPSGERCYAALADTQWEKVETFGNHNQKEIFESLSREYKTFDNERNAQLLKKYVSNFN